jgi:hypothetical protein
VFGKSEVSLNAGGGESSDLAVATRIATSVICTSGFGGDGNLQWTAMPTGTQMQRIDALLKGAYRAALKLLQTERRYLDRIAAALVEKAGARRHAVRRLAQTRSTRRG